MEKKEVSPLVKQQDWLKIVLSGLVENPEEIQITSKEDEQGLLFIITVAKNDNGKIIGKKGTIAEALRIIARAAGYLEGIKVSLKINCPII
jgi:uncharacterized protein